MTLRQDSRQAVAQRALELRLVQLLERHLGRLEEPPPHSLTDLGVAVFALIEKAGEFGTPLNQKGLARNLRSNEESLSPVLKKLREAGLCRVVIVPNTQRNKYHEITPTGRKALREWIQWKLGG